VEAHLGTQEYARLRIGVGPAVEGRSVGALSDYVLGPFGKGETETVRELLPTFTQALELWLREGMGAVMNRFPGKTGDGKRETGL
jgi:PTH1 family peptidyl-tRNA hydrolase